MMTSGDGPEKRNRDSATAMDAKHKHPGHNPSSNATEWLDGPSQRASRVISSPSSWRG